MGNALCLASPYKARSTRMCVCVFCDITIPRFPKSTSQTKQWVTMATAAHTVLTLLNAWAPPPHTHMQSDTFSHKRAALYTSLAWKCQRDFNPLNDTPAGLQWNLRRNQSKTDQCLICRPRAVAALIHRNPPSWKHFCSSIMSWGVFTRYYTTPHYLGWEQHLRKCF